MFKRTKLISMAAIVALLGSGIATATAASDHPKKKTTTTQASKQVAKSTAKPAKPGAARPSAGGYEPGGTTHRLTRVNRRPAVPAFPCFAWRAGSVGCPSG
jgi:hypothetical protein